eukprot:6877396-Karenia_brevis.AAC.1
MFCNPKSDGSGLVHLKARNLGAASLAHTFDKPRASLLPLRVPPPVARSGAHWAGWVCMSCIPVTDGAGLSRP